MATNTRTLKKRCECWPSTASGPRLVVTAAKFFSGTPFEDPENALRYSSTAEVDVHLVELACDVCGTEWTEDSWDLPKVATPERLAGLSARREWHGAKAQHHGLLARGALATIHDPRYIGTIDAAEFAYDHARTAAHHAHHALVALEHDR
jgi:hypothetical protein